MPHDFFQLDRPIECKYPPLLGEVKGVVRFWARKVEGAERRGVSSSEVLILVGELVRSPSDSESS